MGIDVHLPLLRGVSVKNGNLVSKGKTWPHPRALLATLGTTCGSSRMIDSGQTTNFTPTASPTNHYQGLGYLQNQGNGLSKELSWACKTSLQCVPWHVPEQKCPPVKVVEVLIILFSMLDGGMKKFPPLRANLHTSPGHTTPKGPYIGMVLGYVPCTLYSPCITMNLGYVSWGMQVGP